MVVPIGVSVSLSPLDVKLIWHAPSVECTVPVYRFTASKGLNMYIYMYIIYIYIYIYIYIEFIVRREDVTMQDDIEKYYNDVKM